ncbi:MAG: S1C family serine protease [Pseudomonadota bacterium]
MTFRKALLALCLIVLLAPWPGWAAPLDAIVAVRAEIPGDARTAGVLGVERRGSGVIIDDDGLVVTIGYLILEADQVEIELSDKRVLPAEVLAYDYDTGFGLLRPQVNPGIAPLALGDSTGLADQTQVLVVSADKAEPAMPAYVVSRRDFAGYWEYLLPDAIFTAPPYRNYGGAGLIGRGGELLGIGSLFVGDAIADSTLPGNMFVPIEALKPILAELVDHGRAQGPVRPWLGIYGAEERSRVFVNRVAPEGPAAAAGLLVDDLIVAVEDQPVGTLDDFYRAVWSLGEAGVTVPLTLLRGADLVTVEIRSGDRYDYLKLHPSH